MDIRTKLVFALVAVSLGSMLVLTLFTYGVVRDMLRDAAVRQLEAVAESKKQDLEKVVVGWHDRVNLITSRTQLRASLRAFASEGDPTQRAQIERILADALAAVPTVLGVAVYDDAGQLVARKGFEPRQERLPPGDFHGLAGPTVHEKVARDSEGRLSVTFLAPMRLDGKVIGAARVRIWAEELVDVTRDHTGLGETGETLLARAGGQGAALILNPLRHDAGAGLKRTIPANRRSDPTIQAVSGREGIWSEGARDYRERDVWAATRYLDEMGWGLVVKVDAEEQGHLVRELRNTMARLALSLSAFAIVAGALLGLYFARPIRELTDVARRIGDGELELRAKEGSEDEVGQLARIFNEMTERLVATRARDRHEPPAGGSSPP